MRSARAREGTNQALKVWNELVPLVGNCTGCKVAEDTEDPPPLPLSMRSPRCSMSLDTAPSDTGHTNLP